MADQQHISRLATAIAPLKSASDPTKLTPIQLIGKLVKIEGYACTIYLTMKNPPDKDEDKDYVTGLPLSLGSDLASYSCIAKASAAQNNRHAEPNYPQAYSATRADRCIAGLRSLHVPPDAAVLMSTGSP